MFLLLGLGLIIGLSAYKASEMPEYEDIDYVGGFKNLKVLPQDISKDSLMGLMKSYNVALGVKCNHCHDKDKAADTKHEKEVARHMIKFTNELNQNEFAPIGDKYKNAISCAMCHRGSTKPMEDSKQFMPKEYDK